jgi:hypothetical protein
LMMFLYISFLNSILPAYMLVSYQFHTVAEAHSVWDTHHFHISCWAGSWYLQEKRRFHYCSKPTSLFFHADVI